MIVPPFVVDHGVYGRSRGFNLELQSLDPELGRVWNREAVEIRDGDVGDRVAGTEGAEGHIILENPAKKV